MSTHHTSAVLEQYRSGTLQSIPLDTALVLVNDHGPSHSSSKDNYNKVWTQAWSPCWNISDNIVPDNVSAVYDPGNAKRPHLEHAHLDPLDTLSLICMSIEIYECKSRSCRDSRERLDSIAPLCQWTSFRRYIIAIVSCIQCSRTNDGFYFRSKQRYRTDRFRQYLAHFRDFLQDTKEWPTLEWHREDASADMYGALDLIYWIEPLFLARNRLEPDIVQSLHTRQELPMLPIIQASEAVESTNICEKRLWDLVQGNERRECSLPSIILLAKDLPSALKEGHWHCSANHCPPTIENSTLATQKHFCADKRCKSMKLDMHELDDIDVTKPYPTSVWEHKSSRLIVDVLANDWKQKNSYMAVSHVWSDGTGVGMKDPGTLNACLFAFFSAIASRLGCEALWWDTICLPSKREARSLAVSRMHENFRKAKCTIVHDQALLEMEWKDDGSPCLALVVSTWFSRGWTVLELWASESVKVLFKNPQDLANPIIKDLEFDILAPEDDIHIVHPAHRIASDVIRAVRRDFHPGKQHKNNLLSRQLLPRLLSILQPRATSWATDRMIIAGLMARLEDFDAGWSQARITQHILTTFPVLHPGMLLHDKATMTKSGPWSWCPSSLLDFPLHHFTTFSKTIGVQDGGKIWGMWSCQALTQSAKRGLRPCSSHISVSMRIKEALRTWERCLLLSPPDRRISVDETSVTYLLVLKGASYQQKIWEVASSGRRCSTLDEYLAASPDVAKKVGWGTKWARHVSSVSTLDCEYIGTVQGAVSTMASSMYIRLGHDPSMPSEEVEPEDLNSSDTNDELSDGDLNTHSRIVRPVELDSVPQNNGPGTWVGPDLTKPRRRNAVVKGWRMFQ